MLFFAAYFLFLLTTSWFVCRLFLDFFPRLIALFIVQFAIIVGVGNGLALFGALGNGLTWRVCTVGLACLLCVFFAKSKPLPSLVARESLPGDSNKLFTASAWLLYGGSFCVTVLALLVVSLSFPVTNWDAMTYHIPRAFLYLAQGNLEHFDTVNFRQTVFPFNITLAFVYFIVNSAPEVCFTLLQYICWLISGVTVYSLARLYGCRPLAAFAGCWFALLGTGVLAQGFSQTSDICLAAFSLCALYFLSAWFTRKSWRDAIFFGIAIGLAGGTKVTIAFYIPSFLFLIVLFYKLIAKTFITGPDSKKHLLQCGMVIILAALFSLPFSIYNYKATGQLVPTDERSEYASLFAPYNFPRGPVSEGYAPFEGFLQNIKTYSAQYFFDPIQRRPFHWSWDLNALRVNKKYESKLQNFLGFDSWQRRYAINDLKILPRGMSVDTVWFGWGAWLVCAAVVYCLLRKRQWGGPSWAVAAAVLVSLLALCALFKWSWFFQRYLVTAYVLSGVCVAYLYNERLGKKGALVKHCIFFAFFCATFLNAAHYIWKNDTTPLRSVLRKQPIWSRPYVPPTLGEYIANSSQDIHIITLDWPHVDERLYPLMRLNMKSNYFLTSFRREQTPPYGVEEIGGSRIISCWQGAKDFIATNIPGSSTYTLFEIAGKKTKGIRPLGGVGTEGTTDRFNYYAWAQPGIPIEPKNADNAQVMFALKFDRFLKTRFMKANIVLLGLSPEDNVMVRVSALNEQGATTHLKDFDATGDVEVSLPPDFVRLDAVAVDKVSGGIVGKGLLIKGQHFSHSFDSAGNSVPAAVTRVDCLLPDVFLGGVKLSGWGVSEGPYPPQYALVRWLTSHGGSIYVPNTARQGYSRVRIRCAVDQARPGSLRISDGKGNVSTVAFTSPQAEFEFSCPISLDGVAIQFAPIPRAGGTEDPFALFTNLSIELN